MAAPLNDQSTARSVLENIDLSGKNVVVTGATSGIGLETVRAFAGAGAQVIMAVRNVARGQDLAQGIEGEVLVHELDLSAPESIRSFAAKWDGPLDILVNNAGVMSLPTLQHNKDGWEQQFATNHLGHFALSVLLHGALKKAPGARVVVVASSSQSPIDWDDINFDHRPYEPYEAYAQSKTANVLFAVGAGKRWAADDITVHAVMPGIIRTGIQRHVDPEALKTAQDALEKEMAFKTPEQGAATSVYAAVAPELAGVPTRYLEDCHQAPIVLQAGLRGVTPWALDSDNADRLWAISAAATNVDAR
ncbi:SDR family NAD(P)-dependent oxidoreductase [Williamsia soli]|uniref:SDR family NAD(P)-dependent oxidoreductase n=1 Tax=Williamsia soli TaxID=364929 RepID=UPI001A9FA7B1|nr:SDR family NAD(P)-dependent oxidoreductase [Williamsia soli]